MKVILEMLDFDLISLEEVCDRELVECVFFYIFEDADASCVFARSTVLIAEGGGTELAALGNPASRAVRERCSTIFTHEMLPVGRALEPVSWVWISTKITSSWLIMILEEERAWKIDAVLVSAPAPATTLMVIKMIVVLNIPSVNVSGRSIIVGIEIFLVFFEIIV